MSIASAVFGTKKRIVFACTTIFCSTILFSAFSTPTHAEEMGASIEIPPSLTLSVPASVSMNVTPGVKDFDSKSCNIVVGTNSIAGYTLTTSATSTNLTNTTDSTKTISTLPASSEGYTESTFVANKWGYKIGNGNYKPYVSEATLADTHEQTAGDTTALTFATKVDFDQPTGTYNLTVNFSAVAKVYVPPYMQDFTVAEATAMTEGETKTLYDSRDNQKYTTAKINGLLWMTKNLDLAGGTTLTPSDSNVSSNYTLPASSTSGFSDDSTAYVYNSGSTTCGDGSPCYSYYSYVAATAGTNLSSGVATSDICPKGWRLPARAELSTLVGTYNTGAELTGSPFLAVYGGYYNDSSFSYGGSSGRYWSSTAYSSSNAHFMYLGSSRAVVGNDIKRYGVSVRCVKDIPTMQDFTVAEANAMDEGEATTLRDSRDRQDYTVAKLPDGNVWMTQNLRFTGTSINSTTTNIDTTKTLSYGDLTSGNSNTEPRIHDSGNATTGVWYNYCAATAGTICADSDSTEASYSLCPAGWRLPTYSEQSAITSYSSDYSPVAGGDYRSGSLGYTSYGSWWSSTAYYDTHRYGLSWNGSSLNTGGFSRHFGYYVRCVKDIPPAMQDFTAAEADAMTEGETKTLRDARDDRKYTVTKLPDGNVWMTQNLRFTGTSLDPSTSNVSSAKTITYGDLTSGDSYDEARIHDSGNTTEGVWYNYAAASAMSITGSSNTTEATESVCPKGWRLPTKVEQEGITSYSSSFNPVTGGGYDEGSLEDTGDGYWWSSTVYYDYDFIRYYLFYNGSSLDTSYGGRSFGIYVRCVKDIPPAMQDFTAAEAEAMTEGETKTLRDARDDQIYTAAKINGNVWMTQNLRFKGTSLDPSTSNVSSAKTITYGDLTSGDSYDEARIHDSGNTTTGVWYNYAAASAMSITGSSWQEATESVCPKGWRLPTKDEQAGITSYSSSFNPVTGGGYGEGSLITGLGLWWSSTAGGGTARYLLYYNGSSLDTSYNIHYYGFYVRCVRAS